MQVRPAAPEDTTAVASVVLAAFGPDEGPTVVSVMADLRGSGLVERVLVAEIESRVVGVVMLSRGWVDARPRLVEVLVLSPLAVLPDVQAQGVGTSLLEAVVPAAEAAGAPLVFLEGDPGYYGPRGWLPASEAGLGRPSPRIPGPACQVRLLPAHEEWMVGPLVYPDAWWRHDAVGLRDPLLADVEARLAGRASGSL